MTPRRLLTPWWRLLLAICVVALPAATAASFDVGLWRHAARHPAQVHAQAGRVAGVSPSRSFSEVGVAGHHVSWPAAGDIVGAAVALTWWVLAVVRRRAGRALDRQGRLARSRAPPAWAVVSVPTGLAPGSAGRFSRRRNAQFRPRVGTANG